MPRYFFDTEGGSNFHDEDGVALADADEARLYAIKFAGQCMADDAALLAQGQDFRVEVRDSDGLLLFAVTTFVTDSPAIRPHREVGPRAQRQIQSRP